MTNFNTGLDVQRYKDLRRRFLYLAGAFVPVVYSLALASGKLFGTYLPAQIVAIGGMVALAAIWIRLSYWRCPNCAGFIGWWPPLVARCQRCGFPNVTSRSGNVT
jgi:hypothetical protein